MVIFIVNLKSGNDEWYMARIKQSEEGHKFLINNFYTLPQDLEENSVLSKKIVGINEVLWNRDKDLFWE